MPAKKIAHASTARHLPEPWDVPATKERTQEIFREMDQIRARRLPAHVERARLLAAQLVYAGDMLERDLGAPEVRAGLARWIDRLHLDTVHQANLDGPRWLLLIEVVRTAARTAADGARYSPTRTDAMHVHAALKSIAERDPDFAARIDVAAVVALMPLWTTRRRAGGRGQRTRLWPAVLRLGTSAGLRSVSEQTVKDLWKRHAEDLPEHERA